MMITRHRKKEPLCSNERDINTSTKTISTLNDLASNKSSTQGRKLKFSLNMSKTVAKKLEACDRMCMMEEKSGENYVISLSTAGFEAFSGVIMDNLRQPRNGNSRLMEISYEEDETGKIIRDIIKLKSWQAVHHNLAQGRTGQLSATICLFRTHSSAMINGRDTRELGRSVNQLLEAINKSKHVQTKNKGYKNTLSKMSNIEKGENEHERRKPEYEVYDMDIIHQSDNGETPKRSTVPIPS